MRLTDNDTLARAFVLKSCGHGFWRGKWNIIFDKMLMNTR